MTESCTLHVVSSQACVRRVLLAESSSLPLVWTSHRFFAHLRMLAFEMSQDVLCTSQAGQLAATVALFSHNKAQYGRVPHEVDFLNALHGANIKAQHVCDRLAALPAQQQAGLLPLLQRLACTEHVLHKAGLCPVNTVWWRCLKHLQKTNKLPNGLQKFTTVVFDHVIDLCPLQWQLVAQLACLGLPIQVNLPDWKQLGLFAHVIENIRQYLQKQATAGNLHVQCVSPPAYAQKLLTVLAHADGLQPCSHTLVSKVSHASSQNSSQALKGPQESIAKTFWNQKNVSQCELQAAANPHQEAHWIAQRVVAWQRKHPTPPRIVIAFAQITQQAHALQHVLHEYGVRCVFSRGMPFTQSPCMQLVLQVLQARQQAIPVGMVSALLAHSACGMKVDEQKASQLQAMLMQTGVQHDTGVAQNTTGAFLRYLQQFSQKEGARVTMQISLQEATVYLESLLKILYAVPLESTLQNHLQQVMQLLQEHIVPCQDGCHAEVFTFIKDLLRMWNSLAQHDDAAESHVLSLGDFATWLHTQAQQHHIPQKAAMDDALVEIVSIKQLWARQMDYVILAGLQQHNASGNPQSNLLDEQHMSILSNMVGKDVLSCAHNKNQLAAPAAFGALWFAGAMLAAQKGVLASAHLHDEQGKTVLPSTLFYRLCVACNKQVHQLGHVDTQISKPLSYLQHQRAAAQHALQQDDSQQDKKTMEHKDSSQSVLCLSKKQCSQTRLFACMHEQREAFFAHGSLATDFAFAVGAHTLHERFDKLGLRSDSPLTPSRIEALAQCPFRFFVQRLLKVHLPQQESGLSPLQTGQLAHGVLQRFYEQYGQKVESLELPDMQKIVVQLVHECSQPWIKQAYEHEQPLWQGFCMWLQTALVQLIVRQTQHPPIDHIKPKYMELAVGLSHSHLDPVPITIEGKTVFLAGVLDRVDFGKGGKKMCVVVDYKMGSQTQLSSKMAPSSLLRSHFQLPIYHRLLLHHFPQHTHGQLLGYFLSIRDGTPSAVLGGQRHPHWKERIQQDDRPDSLAAALKEVLQPVYDGNVPAHVGLACQHCSLQHVCRKNE